MNLKTDSFASFVQFKNEFKSASYQFLAMTIQKWFVRRQKTFSENGVVKL